MSRLRIFDELSPDSPRQVAETGEQIAAELALRGVRFTRWATREEIVPGSSPEAVLRAYEDDITRLCNEGGYQSFDVVSLSPDHPQRAELRQKFLQEHTHAEDEVRFFVAGRGLFTLHVNTEVLEVLCEQGDLISVPAGTRHWFDMSESPFFVAIRLFTNPSGWVAQFTGERIAERFPRLAA
jgi:1,2-dihydroxy-3-keto-5-methylthiopentene dioxygenase